VYDLIKISPYDQRAIYQHLFTMKKYIHRADYIQTFASKDAKSSKGMLFGVMKIKLL